LREVGLATRITHRPGELSGGEQQRVAIARALAMNPEIILADEPTGNLDTVNSEAVFEILMQASKSRGQAVVLVTHNPALAARADRIVSMEDGNIVSLS
jgi:lipoprotein-releasing system ATP-binding protein